MKGLTLQPMIADENVLVQFTKNVTIEKNTSVQFQTAFRN